MPDTPLRFIPSDDDPTYHDPTPDEQLAADLETIMAYCRTYRGQFCLDPVRTGGWSAGVRDTAALSTVWLFEEDGDSVAEAIHAVAQAIDEAAAENADAEAF